jgi:formate dehydrogenase maturation protein FdhE
LFIKNTAGDKLDKQLVQLVWDIVQVAQGDIQAKHTKFIDTNPELQKLMQVLLERLYPLMQDKQKDILEQLTQGEIQV